jgi:hypothetical protein
MLSMHGRELLKRRVVAAHLMRLQRWLLQLVHGVRDVHGHCIELHELHVRLLVSWWRVAACPHWCCDCDMVLDYRSRRQYHIRQRIRGAHIQCIWRIYSLCSRRHVGQRTCCCWRWRWRLRLRRRRWRWRCGHDADRVCSIGVMGCCRWRWRNRWRCSGRASRNRVRRREFIVLWLHCCWWRWRGQLA